MLKSYVSCVIEIDILLFHLGQVSRMFLICVAKTSSFVEVVYAFHTSQIKLLPHHQYLCDNLEYSVNESASVVHSVFLFEKISVYFYKY